MRILLDECVNPRVKAAFPFHETRTVTDMVWQGIKNGKLLALAESSGFQVFVTVDQNLSYQQNLTLCIMGFVVVSVPSNNIRFYRPLFPDLNRAVENVKPGHVIRIPGT